MHCQADEHFSGSYTAASPTVISPAATSPAVTLLAVASLAAALALMDDPDAARLKPGNLVKEIIAVQATVTKLKGAGEQATRGLEEARKSMAHAELMVQKSLEALKDIGDALERANTMAGELKVVHAPSPCAKICITSSHLLRPCLEPSGL